METQNINEAAAPMENAQITQPKTKKFWVPIVVGIFIIIFGILLLLGDRGDKGDILIGFVGPLSGPVSTLGIENLRGIELAVDDINERGGINGRKVRLIVEDDQFQSVNTVNSFSKLTNIDGVSLVLSPTYNGILSLAEVAQQKKIPLVNSIDATEEIARAGDYVFAIGIYAEGHGSNFARFMFDDLKKTEAAIIYNNDESFVTLIKDRFINDYEEKGGQVVVENSFSFSTTDFRTILLKLRQANIENVVLIGWDETGHFVKQANEMNMDLSIVGLATFTSEGFKANSGGITKGIYHLGWDTDSDEYRSFDSKYENKYNTKSNQLLFAALGYDAMNYILKAIERGGEISKSLYDVPEFNGFTGPVVMSPDGIVRTINAQNSIFGLGE